MSEYIGGNGIYPGSFNPPHVGHIEMIEEALAYFDTLHVFVRYNEGVDLVDWDTKRRWFERINEETGGRLVIHKMENRAVTGKTYTLEDFFDFIRDAVHSVGGPVSGVALGDDYREIVPLLQKEFPKMFFLIGERPVKNGVMRSSSLIREDPEAHREWLPAFVYKTLRRMREEGTLPKNAAPGTPDPADGGSGTPGITDPADGGSGTPGTPDPTDGGTAAPEITDPADGGSGAPGIPDPASDGIRAEHDNCPMEKIDITGCPVVGRGFGSTVYGLDEKTIVKVYKEGTPVEKVQREFRLARAASLGGVPSVRAYRMAKAGNAFGLVMERLSSFSLGAAIHNHPEQTEMYTDQYAALAKKLHHTRVPDDTVPAVRDTWLGYAGRLSRWCSPEETALACELVARMPDGDTFLHGDLHPGNIMFRDQEPVLIDMSALARGHYLCDLAVIYRGLIMGPQSEGIERREKSMGMPAWQIREVGDLFFMKYLEPGSREELEAIYARLHVLYALSVVVMCGNENMKDEALARLIMDNLLRKVVIPGQDTILEIWRDGRLLPERTV